MKPLSSPVLVLSLSCSCFALLSLSPAPGAGASGGSTSGDTTGLGGTEPSQPRNTYQAGLHDGAQAGIESVRGQAEAAAGATTLSSDTGSSKSGCS